MNFSNLGTPILKIAIKYEADVVTARQKTRRIGEVIGFDRQDQVRLATAVSELARNVYQYAKIGVIEFFMNFDNGQTFFIKVTDNGPGIKDLDSIFNGTYVSKSGMGVGLSGTKKLMDHFDVKSDPATGTVIVIGKTLERRAQRIKQETVHSIVDALMAARPENQFEEIQKQNQELLFALDEVRAAKEKLVELNLELAETNRGVIALYAELDEKAATIQKANEVKTSFLSNITHEFKTPLSSVVSLARMLLDHTDGELSLEQEKQVTYIRKSAEGLLELVHDLLDLAKVEAGKVTICSTPFQVEEVLTGLRGVFRPLLRHSEVDLSFVVPEITCELNTDQGKVSQILRNLISNSVKHTETGTIEISTKWLKSKDMIQFSVKDSGVGIAKEFLGLIFEDFGQVDTKLQKNYRGTGLGLPLSRKLARLLGGDLWVESEVGVGSVFYVRIPRIYKGGGEAVLITNDSAEQILDEDEPTDSFKVLLIDDDETSRYVLKNLINQQIDARFLEANSGETGIEAMRAKRPDVVFLDLVMPSLDGIGVLKEISQEPELKKIPVIINTSKTLSVMERDFLSKNACAVLSKNRVDQADSVRLIQEALAKAGFDYR